MIVWRSLLCVFVVAILMFPVDSSRKVQRGRFNPDHRTEAARGIGYEEKGRWFFFCWGGRGAAVDALEAADRI